MDKKIGFPSTIALVIGSQVGSGIFLLPTILAPFGWYSVFGWIISGTCAIILATVFARLCFWLPRTGGPHVFATEAFGPIIGFFTGWTYWVISWVSTTAVIIAASDYIGLLTGQFFNNQNLVIQLLLLLCVALLNVRGVRAAGSLEFVLTVLKFIPLILLPAFCLIYFDSNNIKTEPEILSSSISNTLNNLVMLTLWGFIGLESGTTPAESIENPSITIPVAIIMGTAIVVFLYLFNNIGILGAMPSYKFLHSKAPYADVARYLFGGQWHILISIIASILCFGTLNAWTLSSSQIALGLSRDNFLPSVLGKTNRNGAPYIAILVSSIGTMPLLYLATCSNMPFQIEEIIDFSVIAFLFIYLISCLALLKLNFDKSHRLTSAWVYGVAGTLFCIWILFQTGTKTLLFAFIFVLTGAPIYFLKNKKNRRLNIES